MNQLLGLLVVSTLVISPSASPITNNIQEINEQVPECNFVGHSAVCDFLESEMRNISIKSVKQEIDKVYIYNLRYLHLGETFCTDLALTNVGHVTFETSDRQICDQGFKLAAKNSNVAIPNHVNEIYFETCNVSSMILKEPFTSLKVINSSIGVLDIPFPLTSLTTVSFKESYIVELHQLILEGAEFSMQGSTVSFIASKGFILKQGSVKINNSSFLNVLSDSIVIYPRATINLENHSMNIKPPNSTQIDHHVMSSEDSTDGNYYNLYIIFLSLFITTLVLTLVFGLIYYKKSRIRRKSTRSQGISIGDFKKRDKEDFPKEDEQSLISHNSAFTQLPSNADKHTVNQSQVTEHKTLRYNQEKQTDDLETPQSQRNINWANMVSVVRKAGEVTNSGVEKVDPRLELCEKSSVNSIRHIMAISNKDGSIDTKDDPTHLNKNIELQIQQNTDDKSEHLKESKEESKEANNMEITQQYPSANISSITSKQSSVEDLINNNVILLHFYSISEREKTDLKKLIDGGRVIAILKNKNYKWDQVYEQISVKKPSLTKLCLVKVMATDIRKFKNGDYLQDMNLLMIKKIEDAQSMCISQFSDQYSLAIESSPKKEESNEIVTFDGTSDEKYRKNLGPSSGEVNYQRKSLELDSNSGKTFKQVLSADPRQTKSSEDLSLLNTYDIGIKDAPTTSIRAKSDIDEKDIDLNRKEREVTQSSINNTGDHKENSLPDPPNMTSTNKTPEAEEDIITNNVIILFNTKIPEGKLLKVFKSGFIKICLLNANYSWNVIEKEIDKDEKKLSKCKRIKISGLDIMQIKNGSLVNEINLEYTKQLFPGFRIPVDELHKAKSSEEEERPPKDSKSDEDRK